MTTEEQVAAVRAQVEREREGLKPEGWWQQQPYHGIGPGTAATQAAAATEKKNRVVRFATDSGRRSNAQSGGKRRSVVMTGGKGSGRRD